MDMRGCALARALLPLLLLVQCAWGQVPLPAATTSNAPPVKLHVGLGEKSSGEDPHPVHGVQAPDGSYILCGKTADIAYMTKFDSTVTGMSTYLDTGDGYQPGYGWTAKMGTPGTKNHFLSCAATADAVFVGGLKSITATNIDRYLGKYSLSTGALIWEMTIADTSPTLDGAVIAIELTSDGGLITGGVADAPAGALEGFKSFGNPTSGTAYVEYFDAAQLAATTAPTAPKWSKQFPGYVDVKAVKQTPASHGGGYVALTQTNPDVPPVLMALLKLDMAGTVTKTIQWGDRHEATDVAVVSDGYVITGHGANCCNKINGELTKFDLNGNQVWKNTFGDPAGGIGPYADPTLVVSEIVYDECWGMQPLADDGVVVACGTGVENCKVIAGSTKTCADDPRNNWRSMLVRFDSCGQVVWVASDNWIEDGKYEMTASEHVFLTLEGGFVSVVDQGFGTGLLVYGPEVGAPTAPKVCGASTPVPTVAPTPVPTIAPTVPPATIAPTAPPAVVTIAPTATPAVVTTAPTREEEEEEEPEEEEEEEEEEPAWMRCMDDCETADPTTCPGVTALVTTGCAKDCPAAVKDTLKFLNGCDMEVGVPCFATCVAMPISCDQADQMLGEEGCASTCTPEVRWASERKYCTESDSGGVTSGGAPADDDSLVLPPGAGGDDTLVVPTPTEAAPAPTAAAPTEAAPTAATIADTPASDSGASRPADVSLVAAAIAAVLAVAVGL